MDEDLRAIEEKFLYQCGSCDLGLVEFGCTCPEGDYRPVMSQLVAEVHMLRATLRRAGLVVDPASRDYQAATMHGGAA